MGEEITNGKKSRKGWFYGGLILLFLIALYFGYMTYSHNQLVKRVKELLAVESEKYSDPAAAMKVLVDVCNEAISDKQERRTIRNYAKANKISYEEAIVDRTLKLARSFTYLQ